MRLYNILCSRIIYLSRLFEKNLKRNKEKIFKKILKKFPKGIFRNGKTALRKRSKSGTEIIAEVKRGMVR